MGRKRTLRKRGLANVIAAVLREYGKGKDVCNPNECTLTISNLIRVYGDLFSTNRYVSLRVLNKEGKHTLEHVVPVIFFVKTFMKWADDKEAIDADRVMRYLDQYTYLCKIVKATENRDLDKASLGKEMPKSSYGDDHEIHNVWARYEDPRVNIKYQEDEVEIAKAKKRCEEDERAAQ